MEHATSVATSAAKAHIQIAPHSAHRPITVQLPSNVPFKFVQVLASPESRSWSGLSLLLLLPPRTICGRGYATRGVESAVTLAPHLVGISVCCVRAHRSTNIECNVTSVQFPVASALIIDAQQRMGGSAQVNVCKKKQERCQLRVALSQRMRVLRVLKKGGGGSSIAPRRCWVGMLWTACWTAIPAEPASYRTGAFKWNGCMGAGARAGEGGGGGGVRTPAGLPPVPTIRLFLQAVFGDG